MTQVYEIADHLPHGVVVFEQNPVARDFDVPVQQYDRDPGLCDGIVYYGARLIAGLDQKPIDAALTQGLDELGLALRTHVARCRYEQHAVGI